MRTYEPLTSLDGCKVYVGKHSEAIQRKAFELGFEWPNEEPKEVQATDAPLLYFTRSLTGVIRAAYRLNAFPDDDDFKEVSPEQILAISTPFKPFDRVLMADKGCYLQPNLFRGKIREGYVAISGEIFDCCIPYEGNEYLVGQPCLEAETDNHKTKDTCDTEAERLPF